MNPNYNSPEYTRLNVKATPHASLAASLRLIAAWHTPGGPTPATPQPNKQRVCTEAAELIERLSTHPQPAQAGVWPASADEGMLLALLGWRESDARDGLSGEASMMDRAYHSLYSHMRDKGAK